MRITRHSPQHITVDSPEIFNWVLSIGMIAASLGILLFIGKKVTLTCDRSLPPAGICTLATTSVTGTRQLVIPVGDLREAFVQVSSSDDGKTYRVVLMTAQGKLPFTDYYSSGYSGKQELADEINQFIRSGSQGTLSVKTDDRLVMTLMAGVFGGAGVLLGLFSGITTIDLDRATGLMTVRKRRLILPQTNEYLISDFSGAQVESSSKSNYRVVLLMRDGRAIPLTPYYSSGYKGKERLARELQKFGASSGYETVI